MSKSGYIGSLQADSFHDKQDLLHQTKQTNKAKDALIDHQNINANLGQNNQILLNNNLRLEKEKNSYKDMLARPLMEILDENAELKQALEEQKQLIALWMLRQRAMKKVAVDLGKAQGLSQEKIIDISIQREQQILKGDNLDGAATDSNMKYFEIHKQYLIKNAK